jgi:peptidoglycan/LPS O-acetylase OafA/YrhL
MAAGKKRLVGVDLARFAAAAMVMVFHLAFWSWVPDVSTPGSILKGAVSFPGFEIASWWGFVGVDIFFVISGYVIAYSAEQSSAFRFLRSRVLRLIPAALICATITFAVASAIEWQPARELLQLYIQTIFFYPLGGWIDGVYWTLGVEISFYAIVFILLFLRRFDWIEPIMAAIGLASATTCFFFFFVLHRGVGVWWMSDRLLDLILVHHGMFFAVGVFIWAGVHRGWTPMRLTITVASAAGGTLSLLESGGEMRHLYAVPGGAALPAIIWLLAIGLIVVSIYADRAISDRLSPRVLRSIQVIGLATYPLYLLHDVVGAATMREIAEFGLPEGVALTAAVGSMIALSVAVTLLPEASLRRWLANLFDLMTAFRAPATHSARRRR